MPASWQFKKRVQHHLELCKDSTNGALAGIPTESIRWSPWFLTQRRFNQEQGKENPPSPGPVRLGEQRIQCCLDRTTSSSILVAELNFGSPFWRMIDWTRIRFLQFKTPYLTCTDFEGKEGCAIQLDGQRKRTEEGAMLPEQKIALPCLLFSIDA